MSFCSSSLWGGKGQCVIPHAWVSKLSSKSLKKCRKKGGEMNSLHFFHQKIWENFAQVTVGLDPLKTPPSLTAIVPPCLPPSPFLSPLSGRVMTCQPLPMVLVAFCPEGKPQGCSGCGRWEETNFNG